MGVHHALLSALPHRLAQSTHSNNVFLVSFLFIPTQQLTFDVHKDTILSSDDLTIDTSTNCTGFTLTLIGNNIHIRGSITALNVIIRASDELTIYDSSTVSISFLNIDHITLLFI